MSFEIAISGLQAVNNSIETISNNIANATTYGFKSSRANFADMYAGSQPMGTQVFSTTQTIGIGGSVLKTGGSMDAAIQGRGFFVTRDISGATVYSRVGLFSTDKDGYVVDVFGRKAQGYPLAPGSTMPGPLGDLLVPSGQIPAQATTRLSYVGNMSAGWTVPTATPFDPKLPQSYNSSVTSAVYDSLGNQHSVTQYFVKTGTGTVDVHYTMDGVVIKGTQITSPGSPAVIDTDGSVTGTVGAVITPAVPPTTAAVAGGPLSLSFDTQGQLPTPTPAVTLAATPVGAATMSVAVDYTGTTQFAGAATTLVNNPDDGYASGTLTGVEITEDGSVLAQYSNGQKQSIGMLAMATFPDENGLTSVGNSGWSANNVSGAAVYSTPGVGMAGKLATGAVEQSNVDVTSELVSLMTSQRNYQANSKVIQAESQMMQSLMQAI